MSANGNATHERASLFSLIIAVFIGVFCVCGVFVGQGGFLDVFLEGKMRNFEVFVMMCSIEIVV